MHETQKSDSGRDSTEDADILEEAGVCPAEYRMLQSLSIKNFRGFKHAAVSGLTRVNVITGENSSGKSALLEAFYLGVNATAQAVQNIANFRGVAPILPGGGFFPIALMNQQGSQNLVAYFDHFFHQTANDQGSNSAERITLEFTDSKSAKYRLLIYRDADNDAPTKSRPIVQVQPGASGATSERPIVLDRQRTSGAVAHTTKVLVTTSPVGTLQQQVAAPFGPATLYFGSTTQYAESDNAQWFSQLKERNAERPVLQFIKSQFPFIESIEVLVPGGQSGLYATLTNGRRERVSLVSSGVNKMLSILLAAANNRGGIILIDEIENGIWYEKYGDLWGILHKFAVDTDSQIFVTSHSAECLARLPNIIGDNTQDFCQIRATRGDAECAIELISGVAMKAALAGGNETRG